MLLLSVSSEVRHVTSDGGREIIHVVMIILLRYCMYVYIYEDIYIYIYMRWGGGRLGVLRVVPNGYHCRTMILSASWTRCTISEYLDWTMLYIILIINNYIYSILDWSRVHDNWLI